MMILISLTILKLLFLVIPKDYKEVMEFVREKEVEGLNREEALAFAFNAKVGIN